MRHFYTALVMVLLPAGAVAQTVAFDIGPTAACVDAGEGDSCIGLAAEKCVADSEDESMPAVLAACLDQELHWWRKRGQESVLRLLPYLRERDAESGQGGPSGEAALTRMDRSFARLRKERCRFEVIFLERVDDDRVPMARCHLQMTARHALYLDGWEIPVAPDEE